MILAAGGYLLSSCKKNDQSNNGSTGAVIVRGSWSVARYTDNGNDETSHYKDYRFAFSAAGIITATGDTAVVNGAWGTTTEDNEHKLILSFGVVPFSELTAGWHVIHSNDSVITLEDVRGGNAGADSLTFKKI